MVASDDCFENRKINLTNDFNFAVRWMVHK